MVDLTEQFNSLRMEDLSMRDRLKSNAKNWLKSITVGTLIFLPGLPVSILIYTPTPTLAQVQTSEQPRDKLLRLYQLGVDQLNKSQYQSSLQTFQEALVIAREIKESQGEGAILSNIGEVYRRLGQYSQALEFYNPALSIFKQLGDKANLAATLNNIGSVYDSLGQYTKSLEFYNQSLVIVKEIGDKASEGKTLNNIGLIYDNLGQYTQALEFYNQALAIHKQIGNKAGEGSTLSNIGGVYRSLGQYSQALEFFNQALSIFKQLGDKSGEGTTLNNIGAVYINQGQYSQALEFLTQALAIFKQISDKAKVGTTLNSIAAVYNNQGQYSKALLYYQQALAIRKELGDKAGEGITLNNIAAVYNNQGQYSKALDLYFQALVIFKQVGNKAELGTNLNNIASIYDSQGQYSKAFEFYQQALSVKKQIGDRAGEGTTINNMGTLFRNLGDYSKALDLYQQALAIKKQIGDRAVEGIILNNIGEIYLKQQKYPQALESFNQALVISQKIGDKAGEGQILINIGTTYQEMRDYSQAREFYQQALAISQKIGDKRGEAIALNNIGTINYDEKQYSQALKVYNQALDITQQIGDKAESARILSNIGNVYLKQENYTDAEKSLVIAIEILESLRPGLTDGQKISIFETQATTYRLLQEVLIAQNKINPALEIAERSRARAFVELLASKRSQTSNISSNNKNQGTTDSVSAKPPNIEKIQQIAQQQKATFVEYTINKSQLYIWVIKPTGKIVFKQVDIKALDISSLTDLVNNSRISIGARGRGFNLIPTNKPIQRQDLKKLHQLLIEPIASFLPTNPEERVIFIPHESLFLVPFPALQDKDGKYLIEKHTTLTSPAIQISGFTAQQQKPKGKDILIIGNPTMPFVGVPSVQLPSLKYALSEAKAIARLENTTFITGDEATKATFKQKLPSARIIHLATHGLLEDAKNKGIPTAIALAPSRADGDDGLLTPAEIMDLPINAELVVLSACDTGRGTITGDGVIGLSRSVIAAGASSVIVSLWSVPDASTSELMVQFYQRLQQNPDKAVALRQAMLSTLKKYPSPVYWAAFTLIGE